MTSPIPGPPASVLSAILRANSFLPYDGTVPTERRRATFSAGPSMPFLPSLITDVVFMPQNAVLDANIEVTGDLTVEGTIVSPGVTDWLNVVTGYGAVADGVMLSDAAMTSSSATFTSASATFTAADVGKPIAVNGAGSAGANLKTTIATWTSANTVTLAAAAGSTVTNAYAAYGTDNTTAFANAVAVAGTAQPPVSNGAVVYVPRGFYVVTAAMNWRVHGLAVQGDGPNCTYIIQLTDNTPIVEVAGQYQNISGLTLTYPYQQTSAQTSAICMSLGDDTVGSCFGSVFSQLRMQWGSTIMSINPAITTSAGMFSCTFQDLTLAAYAVSAMHLDANNFLGANTGTGFVMRNIYTVNKDPISGAQGTATSYAVFIRNYNELFIDQLNVEHSTLSTQHAIGLITVNNAVLNSIHCEGLTLSATGKGLLFINNATTATVNGLTSLFNIYNGASENPVALFSSTGPGALILNGFYEAHCTVTTPSHPLVDFGSATNCVAKVAGIAGTQTTANVLNGTNAGCRAQIGTPAAAAAFLPANPTATSSTSLVMMGLGATCAYTPQASGNVLINITGFGTTAVGAAQFNVAPRYGTGTAPSNGDAVSGTRFGCTTDQLVKVASIGGAVAFGFTAIVSLTAGTAYWFDLALDTNTGADAASVSNVSMTMAEQSG